MSTFVIGAFIFFTVEASWVHANSFDPSSAWLLSVPMSVIAIVFALEILSTLISPPPYLKKKWKDNRRERDRRQQLNAVEENNLREQERAWRIDVGLPVSPSSESANQVE
jgi:hypothetical protein